jgi:AcrR family transcriptional regulator
MKGVRSKAKPNKRDAILNAMLDVVVERGFHEAPMSLIEKRSGASAGVIYHHFASKEEIIQALYERELRFLDQYENAGFHCRTDKNSKADQERAEFERRFRSRSKGGVSNELPPEVIQELTLGLAARLAKQPRSLTPKFCETWQRRCGSRCTGRTRTDVRSSLASLPV